MTKNFLKLTTGTKPQFQEAQRTIKKNTKNSVHWHITYKLEIIKDKETIVKEVRRKNMHLTYRGTRIRNRLDLSLETIKEIRVQSNQFKNTYEKKKTQQPKNCIQSFKSKVKTKNLVKQNLREFVTSVTFWKEV